MTANVEIGFKTAQMNVDWPTLLATWELGDTLTVFGSGWLYDHFVAIDGQGGGSHEAWTVAAALAARTSRLTMGHLVIGNTYRHAPLLAKMAATLDHVSAGRFILGLGAGHRPDEHHMYGIDLPPAGDRIARLESSVRVLKGLWGTPGGISLDAPPFTLRDAVLTPPPLTRGGPRLWLGTQGVRKGLRIVARYADGWNSFGTFDQHLVKLDALRRHCDEVGRDLADIEITVQIMLRDADWDALLGQATRYLKSGGVSHVILGMPAGMGPAGLRQLADRVATPLRDSFA